MDRRRRIIVVFGLIAVLAALMSIGSEPELDLSVDELMESPDAHDGDTFRIRGMILAESIDSNNQTLTLAGESTNVTVNYAGTPLPAGATDGKTISVRGEFDLTSGEWTMYASEIKTGCPSKYEAESEA
jgi:cytochrome c-type biogenesis protein CcmE